MWNRKKIIALFSQCIRVLTEEERYINVAIERKKEMEKLWKEGEDKLACIMSDTVYDDIPEKYRSKIREIIETDIK